MRTCSMVSAVAVCTGLLVSATAATAQNYAPWPPPPGMTAGEYTQRYLNRGSPGYRSEYRYDSPRVESERRYRRYREEPEYVQRPRRYYYDDDY